MHFDLFQECLKFTKRNDVLSGRYSFFEGGEGMLSLKYVSAKENQIFKKLLRLNQFC